MRATWRILPSFGVDRRIVFLFGLMTVCWASLMGQAPNNSPDGTPVLFGTNTDVNNRWAPGERTLGWRRTMRTSNRKSISGVSLRWLRYRMVNPSIGNGGGLVVMYATRLGRAEDTSPPSTLGFAGFGTALGVGG